MLNSLDSFRTKLWLNIPADGVEFGTVTYIFHLVIRTRDLSHRPFTIRRPLITRGVGLVPCVIVSSLIVLTDVHIL